MSLKQIFNNLAEKISKQFNKFLDKAIGIEKAPQRVDVNTLNPLARAKYEIARLNKVNNPNVENYKENLSILEKALASARTKKERVAVVNRLKGLNQILINQR